MTLNEFQLDVLSRIMVGLIVAAIILWTVALIQKFNKPSVVTEWNAVPDPSLIEYGYRSDGVLVFRYKE